MTTDEEIQAQEVGARLRQLREKLGKSQSDFAKILGINQQGYSPIESGKRLPTSSQNMEWLVM
jgi:transcriptional regulator with XRE-family HTH domain